MPAKRPLINIFTIEKNSLAAESFHEINRECARYAPKRNETTNIKHMKNNKLNPNQSTFASIEYTKKTGEVCKMKVILGVSYANAVKRSLNELNGLGEYGSREEFITEAAGRTAGTILAKSEKGLLAKPETMPLDNKDELLRQSTEMVKAAIAKQLHSIDNPKPRKESQTGNVLFPCIIRNSKTVKKGEPKKQTVSAAQTYANKVVRGMLPHGQWMTLDQAEVSELNGKTFTA